MTDIRIALGQFSYATGSNVGDNAVGGRSHHADVDSIWAADGGLILTVENDDYSLNAGEKIGFRFIDADGHEVIVGDGVIQQSAYTDGNSPNMSGILTAYGIDSDGNGRALLLDMTKKPSQPFSAGTKFDDSDDEPDVSNNTDIRLDKPINLLYFGKFPDVDVDESDASSDPDKVGIFSDVTRTGDDLLQIVGMQPQDQHDGNDLGIFDNDRKTGPDDPLDRISYISPDTGQEVIGHIDSTANYYADIKYGDGTTNTDVLVTIVQMTNGETFVAETFNNGSLDNKTIQAITVREADDIAFAGLYDLSTIENTLIVCFAAGSMIRTAVGEKPVETLSIGDLVETVDHGIRPLSWVGARRVDAATLDANPNLRPIRIQSGALGPNMPSRDLIVSPQHRILISSDAAQNITGNRNVLIAAKHLLSIEGIDVAVDIDEINYVHFLFDQHELVYANGAITESMFTGPQALQAVSPAARAEIFEIFPELKGGAQPTPCRVLTKGKTGRAIATAIASERASTQIWLQ